MYLNRLPAMLFLLLSLGYGWSANYISLDFWSEQEIFNARTLPVILSFCGVIISLLLILRSPGMLVIEDTPQQNPNWKDLRWGPTMLLLVLMSTYGFILEYLGFFLSTSLFLITGFYILGARSLRQLLKISIPLALGLVLGFWWLMNALGIYLDPGVWWHLLNSETTCAQGTGVALEIARIEKFCTTGYA